MITTKLLKLFTSVLLLIFSFTGVLYGSSAMEIMTKVDARYTGDSAISDWRMILIDKKDRKREGKSKFLVKNIMMLINQFPFLKVQVM